MKLFTITILLISSIFSFAQNHVPELIGDRPDMTESAFTIAKGHLQVETGFDFSKESSISSATTFNSTLLRYGISEKAELRFGFEYVKSDFNSIASHDFPLYIGTKIHLLEKENIKPQVALIIASGIEWLDAGLGNLVFDFTPNAIFTLENDLTENISIGYNLGVEYSTLSRELTGILSASLGIGLGENSGIYLEGAWFPASITKDARFNAGFTHQLTPSFQFDLYGGIGLLVDSPVFNTGAGVIYLF